MDHDNALALVHIGIMLSEYDSTLEMLPRGLIEVQQRLKDTFGVDLHNVLEARDAIIAVTEVSNEYQIH